MSKNTLSSDVDALYISFLLGTKKYEFYLNVSSYFPLKVAGVDWENTYTLKLDDNFYQFLLYLEGEYNSYLTFIENIREVVIKESDRGTNNKNLPWIYTLIVKYNSSKTCSEKEPTEVIEFFPHECTLLGDTNYNL